MSEMVKRVEEAILGVGLGHGTLEDFAEDMARAAIAAMRDPTEAMLEAIAERPTALIEERTTQGHTEYAARMDAAVATERLVLRQRWQAMIDEALK